MLAGELDGLLSGWLVGWFAGWLVSWIVCWLAGDKKTATPIDRTNDQPDEENEEPPYPTLLEGPKYYLLSILCI